MSYSGRRLRVYATSGLIVACLALSSVMLLAQQPPYERIVVFGTSFSDSGNAAIVVGSSTPPATMSTSSLVPNRALRAGRSPSVERTHLDRAAGAFDRTWRQRAACAPHQRRAGNELRGRRHASHPKPWALSTLNDQVNLFLAEFNGVAPPDALYVMEMGANDVSDAVNVFAAGQDFGSAILIAAVQSIVDHIQLLHAAGARHFLVENVPSLGYAPAVRALDPVLSRHVPCWRGM